MQESATAAKPQPELPAPCSWKSGPCPEHDYQAGLPTADMALFDFALKLARNAPWLSGEDIATLRRHGGVGG
jgi:hypothetical protein